MIKFLLSLYKPPSFFTRLLLSEADAEEALFIARQNEVYAKNHVIIAKERIALIRRTIEDYSPPTRPTLD